MDTGAREPKCGALSAKFHVVKTCHEPAVAGGLSIPPSGPLLSWMLGTTQESHDGWRMLVSVVLRTKPRSNSPDMNLCTLSPTDHESHLLVSLPG